MIIDVSSPPEYASTTFFIFVLSIFCLFYNDNLIYFSILLNQKQFYLLSFDIILSGVTWLLRSMREHCISSDRKGFYARFDRDDIQRSKRL